MEKVKSFNVYIKKGKCFAVIETLDGRALAVNYGLMEYAIKHPRNLDDKESKNEQVKK